MRLNPFRSFFQRPPHRGGGKALMVTFPFAARPAAASPTGGYAAGPGRPVASPADGRVGEGDRLSALLDAVGRLADQQRSLLDALRPASPTSPAAADAPPAAATSPAATPGPRPVVSADDVRAVVAEALRAHAASAARDAYAREHLADLPEAYRRLLPAGADPAALAAAEQAIRRQFRDDLRVVARAGGSPAFDPLAAAAEAVGGDAGRRDPMAGLFADVGGDDDAAGRPPAAAVDYAKLSPLQQIAVGLRGSVPPPAPAAGRRAAARPEAGPPPAPASVGPGGRGAIAPDADDPHEALFVGAD